MAPRKTAEQDFGEATLTSKGQLTLPSALRQELSIETGDRLRFIKAHDGTVRIEPRKRRRIVDLARVHAFRVGEDGASLDRAIDISVTAAVHERDSGTRSKRER